MSFIVTHSGIPFDLVRPIPSMVQIEDIAHALARIPRFNGHTRAFYSVAEHSLLVSRIVAETEPGLALVGLLHDAPEAYIGDVTTPLKAMLGAAYRRVELRVKLAIQNSLLVHIAELAPVVRAADQQALVSEAVCYLGVEDFSDWQAGLPDPEFVLDDPLSPEKAEVRFLERYADLKKLERAA